MNKCGICGLEHERAEFAAATVCTDALLADLDAAKLRERAALEQAGRARRSAAELTSQLEAARATILHDSEISQALLRRAEAAEARADELERNAAQAQVEQLREALERIALLKEDIPDEMADNKFVFDIPVWLIRQVREDLESALSAAPADSTRAAFRAGAEAMLAALIADAERLGIGVTERFLRDSVLPEMTP